MWNSGHCSFGEMSELPLTLRNELEETFSIDTLSPATNQTSADGTEKISWKTSDGLFIESVLIPSGSRITACISVQAGCKLGCRFCATGLMGFERDLDSVEIFEQMLRLDGRAEHSKQKGLSNIVVMGMGEPLLNYDECFGALDLFCDKNLRNFSPRRITVSTAGIVPGILRMARDHPEYSLAVSLHSADARVRENMMPVASKYPLDQLSGALKEYHVRTGNRITLEYILFRNVNDSLIAARQLAQFCKKFPVKINLLTYNPVAGTGYYPSTAGATAEFFSFFEKLNIPVQLRTSRGADIRAACGQLATKNLKNKIL